MTKKEELLEQAISFNKDKKFKEVDDLLTDVVIETYNDVELYAEKANALWNLNNLIQCEKHTNIGYQLNPNNSKINETLGNLFLHKKEFEKSFKHYKKAIEIDSSFSAPYNGLGNLYFFEKNYQTAESYYLKAIDLDPNFIKPYIGIGMVYNEKKNFIKAEEFYFKAIEIDPTVVLTYHKLGNIYLDKADFENSEKYYKKAIELDSDFGSSYNGIGNIYLRKREYDKALSYYNIAIEKDHSTFGYNFNVSTALFEKKEYEKSKSFAVRYIELKNDDSDVFTKRAKARIEEIDSILESKQFEKITTTISKIKGVLCFKNGSITHYTGISVAKFLIIDETQFRLSEGAFLNDTSEGTILFDYLDFDTSVQNDCGPNATFFSKKPFIGSFVNQTKKNDLTLWRMYGKENLEEAKGCSITIDIKELKESISQKLKSGIDDLKDFEELEFYKVAYLQNEKFTFSDAKKTELTKLNSLMKELQGDVKAFKDKVDKKPNEVLKIIELLNEVAYLFKNAEYQYESEVRLVMKDAIGFDKKIDTEFIPPKVYVELVSILPMIKEITIGPKVERADEWASAFYYHLINQDLKPEISISSLPFK